MKGHTRAMLGKVCLCSQTRERPRQGDQQEVWGSNTGKDNRGLSQGTWKCGCHGGGPRLRGLYTVGQKEGPGLFGLQTEEHRQRWRGR